MLTQPIEVLLVEDNPADARILAESLKDVGPPGFHVTHATRLKAAIEALSAAPFHVIALDLSLPDSTGLPTVSQLQSAAPGVPLVVLTGLQDEALALQAVRQGVQDYLIKGQCEAGLAARALRYAVERRRAEEALRDREARLAAIVDTAVDAIITIDDRGLIESVNPATGRLFGYAREEMLGRNVNMLMPQPYLSEHDAYLERYLRTGEPRIIGVGREVVGLRKDGTTFPLDLSVSEFRVGGRRMFTGILHDASNRRRLEREILEASANEQRRVGHELHDGLCQQLTATAFAAELLARRLKDDAPAALPMVRKLEGEIDQAITQARTLARGLNPVEVHAGGLAAALEDLSRKVSDSFQIACRFDQRTEATVGDNAVETHLFRIAQEAVSNAIRHGKAGHIQLRLEDRDQKFVLSITDDGQGFAASQSPDAARRTSDGIGLQTMSHRAKMINGLLDVRPARRRGVVVSCSIPLKSGAGKGTAAASRAVTPGP
jgi:two-component system CheB/CheR fusion protein